VAASLRRPGSSFPGTGQPLHEHSCHAPTEGRLPARDRLADEGDGGKDFPGRNVVARVPGVYRPGEERLQRRLEPVQEVLQRSAT